MFCNKCGKPLDDNALFCTNCGNKIKKQADEPVNEIKNEIKSEVKNEIKHEVKNEPPVTNEIKKTPEASAPEAGREKESGAVYAPAATMEKPKEPVKQNPVNIKPEDKKPVYNAYAKPQSPNAALKIKKIIKSPVFLIATICMSICVIMNFVLYFMLQTSPDVLTEYLEAIEYPNTVSFLSLCGFALRLLASLLIDYMEVYPNIFNFISFMLLLIHVVPYFLMNLGLILFRANINKKAGTGCIRAGVIVNIVYFAVITILTAIVWSIGINEITNSGTVEADADLYAMIVMTAIVIAVALAVIAVMRFFYLGFLCSAVSKTAKAINTGVLSKKASLYVTVMHFATAVFCAVAALACVVWAFLVANVWLFAVNYLVMAATYVLFGIVFVKLREVESVK